MSLFAHLHFHIKDLAANEETVRSVKDWKPDIVISHNLTGCGFRTPREIGVPWFHILHDVQLFEPSGKMMAYERAYLIRPLWRFFWASLRQFAMDRPRGVISPTKWLLDEHLVYGLFDQLPSAIIPNPIEIPSVQNGPRDAKSLLFVGRLDTDKGLGVLFDAWSSLRDGLSGLTLVGSGPWRARFEELKDEKIRALGPLGADEVASEMSKAGTVVVPSLVCENQSTVLLEALAAGCQVVASDVGGMRETAAGCATLVPAGAVSALVQACLTAAQTMKTDEERTKTSELLSTHRPDRSATQLESFVRSNL